MKKITLVHCIDSYRGSLGGNTIKFLSLLLVTMLTFSCGSDDDSQPEPEPTVEELLTSDRWYWETSTDFVLSSCNKNTYFDFDTEGNFSVQQFESDLDDNCVSETAESGLYVLSNDTELSIFLEGISVAYTIITITETALILTDESGDSNYTFDKIEGE